MHLGVVPGGDETAHRLAHLPNRAAFERERRGVDDGLVANAERPQPGVAPEGQRLAAGAEHPDPEPAQLRERARLADDPA